MKFNLGYKKENDIGSVLRLLNVSAYDFYSGECEFDDPDYVMTIKSVLLRMLQAIERTINGVFNCDLNYPEAIDYQKLKKCFPVGCSVLEISSQDKVRNFSILMTTIRNINAHALVSDEDKHILKRNYQNLNNLEKLCLKTNYTNKGLITLSGLIALILLFLREPAIKQSARSTRLVSFIATGSPNNIDVSLYVNKVSHVDLEFPIREKTYDDLYGSVLGEYKNKVITNSLLFGYEDNPSYNVSFKIENDVISVSKNSITKVYYSDDYNLKVVDEKGFIELSNQFPPFVFVDLLYKLGIKNFKEVEYRKIQKNIELYSKLNYPKFYCDKNIDILIMSGDIADYRVVSGSITDAVNSICLGLEYSIIKKNKGKLEDAYSNFHELIKLININPENKNKISLLRNASMHGLILGEACFYRDLIYVYDFRTVISTLESVLSDLKTSQKNFFKGFQEDIYTHVVNKLLGLRYNQVVDYTKNYLMGNKVQNPTDERVKNMFIFPESSSYDISLLNKLFKDKDVEPIVIKYVYKKERYPFYVWNKDQMVDLVKQYMTKHKLKEIESIDMGILKIVQLG